MPFTVALVPLIVYLFSVLSSSRLNWFYTKFGRKAALSVGTIICVISLGSMLLLTESTGWVMYIIAAFVGTFMLIHRCFPNNGALNRHQLYFWCGRLKSKNRRIRFRHIQLTRQILSRYRNIPSGKHISLLEIRPPRSNRLINKIHSTHNGADPSPVFSSGNPDRDHLPNPIILQERQKTKRHPKTKFHLIRIRRLKSNQLRALSIWYFVF